MGEDRAVNDRERGIARTDECFLSRYPRHLLRFPSAVCKVEMKSLGLIIGCGISNLCSAEGSGQVGHPLGFRRSSAETT